MRVGGLLIEVQNCHGHSFIPSIVVLALCSDLWNFFMCVCAWGWGGGRGQYRIKSPLDGITPNKNLRVPALCCGSILRSITRPFQKLTKSSIGDNWQQGCCTAIPSLLLLYSALNCFTCGFGVTSPNIHSSILCIHSPTLLFTANMT